MAELPLPTPLVIFPVLEAALFAIPLSSGKIVLAELHEAAEYMPHGLLPGMIVSNTMYGSAERFWDGW